MTEYGADMAPSADAETRAAWPASWLPPGLVADRGVAPPDMSEASCADNANWWWGPGRDDGEAARVWYKRGDGTWEEGGSSDTVEGGEERGSDTVEDPQTKRSGRQGWI